MYGFLYVAYCDALPGLYKIGSTNGAPSERLRQLSAATGVPERFNLLMAAEIDNAQASEREVHRVLDQFRYNPRREFFALPYERLNWLADWLNEQAEMSWCDDWRLHSIQRAAA